MSDMASNQNQKDSELNKLLDKPSQMDPEHIQKNMRLPLEMCQQGRELLKNKQYLKASKSFSKSVMSYQFLLKNALLSKQQTKQMFKEIMIPAYSNLALCNLKMGGYESVISFCNQILNHQNSNIKAKYRRGIAYHQLKKYEEAIDDFTNVIHLDESMREECEWQIKQCKKGILKERENKKKFATTFIQNLNDPRSQSANISSNGKITTIINSCLKKLQKCKDWLNNCWKNVVIKKKQN